MFPGDVKQWRRLLVLCCEPTGASGAALSWELREAPPTLSVTHLEPQRTSCFLLQLSDIYVRCSHARMGTQPGKAADPSHPEPV